MAESFASVAALRGSDKGQDLYNFTPPISSPPTRSRYKELSRRRLSLAGFDVAMQSQRADFRYQPTYGSPELEARPAKRHQAASKSFSSPRPLHLNGLRTSYQTVKANAKHKLQTIASSKRRAASNGTHDPPMLQRTRSLFGLRSSTAAISPLDGEDTVVPMVPRLEQEPMPATFAWTQYSGAAARQSARDFGKSPSQRRSRYDSAFGEHRRRSNQNRESGISLAAEMENLNLDGLLRSDSVPDIPRHGTHTWEMPA